jgi:primosomal protein N' (replication factor Y)
VEIIAAIGHDSRKVVDGRERMRRSQATDSTGYLWVEEGEPKEGMVAEVAPILPVAHTYSFTVPPSMEHALSLGQRVMVPLGRRGRPTVGFVVGLDRRAWDNTLRPVGSLVDAGSFLTADLIELGREISAHYCCPLGQTLKAITPEAVRKQRGLSKVRYARLIRTPDEIRASGKRVGAKRQALIEALSGSPVPIRTDELLRQTASSAGILQAMSKDGWVEVSVRHEVQTEDEADGPAVEPSFELNEEQRTALEQINAAIDADRFSVTLLFGVSGCGKTEVYIRAMRRVLEAGRQAILLVPEIVLTTQLVGRLAARFPHVAVNHSGLTEAERSLQWRRIAAGDKQVVIGTRSAVFAPCPKLGLICVDEEQETSFKNLQAPRFHVRDVAIMRGRQLNIPIVLGSATPSLETWYKSEHRPEYRRLVISRRVKDLPMPKVHIVDMENEYAELKRAVVFSRTMERLLGETLSRGEQALILMNRRGFAHRVFCPACRMRLTCPNCNVGLVVHTAIGQSICHYCRCRVVTPTVCPNVTCGEKLVQVGLGTQRVETLLTEQFPRARIQRVDSDTMSHRTHYQRIVDDFEARKIDVLVGTQMIAKGLDFPFVSFVGVVHADTAALATDFRAHERLFQLITQVAGRAGRADAPGQVVVQTMTPEMPALSFALRHDYPAFAEAELKVRQQVGFPPFRRLARVVLMHPREERARREAEALVVRIHSAIEALKLTEADIIGPNPCTLSRLRGRYRYDVLVRAMNASDMRRLTARLEADGALRTKAESIVVDVDPVSLA